MDVTHDASGRRFATIVDGHACEVDYRLADGVMTITHTGVPSAVGGRGIAGALTRAALEHARALAWRRQHPHGQPAAQRVAAQAIELGGIVDLDQRVHAAIDRRRLDLRHLPVVERGDDDQDSIGPDRARFGDLPWIDHEVLAKNRKVTRTPRIFEITLVPLEVGLVGED